MMNNAMKLGDFVKELPVLSIDGMKPVSEVLGVLDACGRHVVGVTLAGKFVGIFSYADFVRRVLHEGRHPRQTPLIEVTNLEPIAVSSSCSIYDAFDLMSRHSYNHLPVLSSDRHLLGIVTSDDLRREIAREKSTSAKNDYLRLRIAKEFYIRAYCSPAFKI